MIYQSRYWLSEGVFVMGTLIWFRQTWVKYGLKYYISAKEIINMMEHKISDINHINSISHSLVATETPSL